MTTIHQNNKLKSITQKFLTFLTLASNSFQNMRTIENPKFLIKQNHHLFESKKFSLDTLSSNDFFFLELTDHIRLHHKLKTQYIYDILHKNKEKVLNITTLNKNNITDLMSYEIMYEANHTFAEGIIPIHIIQKSSYEGFKANVELKYFENWTRLDTQADVEENEKAAKADKGSAAPISSRLLQSTNTASEKGGKFLETTYFMSSWLVPDYAKMLFSLIAIVLKSLVTIIQFFLVFVRPCITTKNTLLHDWTISFASTMMWIQEYLFIGLLSQNFGGALNQPINEMMRTSRSIYSERFDKEYLESIFNAEKKYKGAGYWDLAINGYVPSPILENWVGSILLVLSVVGVAVLRKNKYRKYSIHNNESERLYLIAKETQIGVLLSFMVPLNVSSVNCIFATFKSGIFDVMGILSFIFSIFVIGYYFYFIIELCRKNPFRNQYGSYYSHLNFDLPKFYAKLVVPYVEYLTLYFLIFIEVAFANEHFLPIALSILLLGFLVIILATTPSKNNDFSELSKINLWKKINIFMKLMLLTIILIFLYFNDKMSLQFVKVFTIFALLLMFIIFLGYIYVLFLRLAGTARRGMGDIYPSYLERTTENDYEDLDLELSRSNRRRGSRLSGTGYSRRERSGFEDFNAVPKKSEYMSDFMRSRRGRLSNGSRRSRMSGGRRMSNNGWDDWDHDYAKYVERSEFRDVGTSGRGKGRHYGYMNFDRDF